MWRAYEKSSSTSWQLAVGGWQLLRYLWKGCSPHCVYVMCGMQRQETAPRRTVTQLVLLPIDLGHYFGTVHRKPYLWLRSNLLTAIEAQPDQKLWSTFPAQGRNTYEINKCQPGTANNKTFVWLPLHTKWLAAHKPLIYNNAVLVSPASRRNSSQTLYHIAVTV